MSADATMVSRVELSRDPYPAYRRLREQGACVWLEAAGRYVVPRWEDVVALDDRPGITAREDPSLMTRAMGRSMLRTDGEEHARLRAPAQAPLRFRGFAARWGDMLEREAHDLLDAVARARAHGRAARLRRPVRRANPEAAARAARCARRRPRVRLAGVHRRDRQLRRRRLTPGSAASARTGSSTRPSPPTGTAPRTGPSSVPSSTPAPTARTRSARTSSSSSRVGLNEPRDVIATTLHALLADPEQEALAREDPENLAKATEESLRWTSPIGMFPRWCTRTPSSAGVELAAGPHRRAHRLREPRRAPLGGPRPLRPAPRDRAPHGLLARPARLPRCVRGPPAGRARRAPRAARAARHPPRARRTCPTRGGCSADPARLDVTWKGRA